MTSDFPTINENHRGKRYCYTYGVSSFSISRHALVKKNLCNSEEDKVKVNCTLKEEEDPFNIDYYEGFVQRESLYVRDAVPTKSR